MTKKIKVKEDMKQVQLDLFTQVEIKLENSTNILDDMRVSPFLPLIKITKGTTYKKFIENENILVRETPWGTIRIRNRLLNQNHKDLLNAIYVLGNLNRNKIVDKEGRIIIFFSKYELIKKLNLSDSGDNYKKIDNMLAEIKDTVIERINTNNKIGIAYNIIDDKGFDENGNYGVTLSKVYSKLYVNNWTVDLTKRIDELIAIKGEGSGIVKSIIDHFITHEASDEKRVYISLEKIINVINYPVDTAKQLSQIKSTLKKYKTELNSFGIDYDSKKQNFIYIGTENINKYPPLITEK